MLRMLSFGAADAVRPAGLAMRDQRGLVARSVSAMTTDLGFVIFLAEGAASGTGNLSQTR